jgi:TPR repeat protein
LLHCQISASFVSPHVMTPSDATQLLELLPPVTKADLKKAYRDALMVWHPDRFTGNPELQSKAEARTYRINEAYDVLRRLPDSAYPYGVSSERQNDSKSGTAPARQAERSRPAASASTAERPAAGASPPTGRDGNARTGLQQASQSSHDRTARRKRSAPPSSKAQLIQIAALLICILLIWVLLDWGMARKNLVAAPDAEKIERLRTQAETGDAQAQYRIGLAYYEGDGITKDLAEAVRWFRKAAEQGNANAQHEVSVAYASGEGVAEDLEESVKWIRLAAAQGHSRAQCNLGNVYYHGVGVAKEVTEAATWYMKAADQGLADAQQALGAAYRAGQGVPLNYVEAHKWTSLALAQSGALPELKGQLINDLDTLESLMTVDQIFEAKRRRQEFKLSNNEDLLVDEIQSPNTGKQNDPTLPEIAKTQAQAAEGNAEAQREMALAYSIGGGVPKDESESRKLYAKAAEQGDAQAQLQMGLFYREGNGLPKDLVASERWLRKAAEQGNAGAECQLGFAYSVGEGVEQNYEAAVRWFLKSAEKGNATAQCNLGKIYSTGKGVPPDMNEARRWFKLAAEQDDAEAQFNLGACFDETAKTTGSINDSLEAAKWYRKAAEQGNPKAQGNLGNLYDSGRGVSHDVVEAAKWYRKAAEQGHKIGQLNLGLCYQWGDGITKNNVDAYKWLSLAAAQGDEQATKHLSVIEGEMTSAEITTAKRMASEFNPSSANSEAALTVPDTPPKPILRHLSSDNRLSSGSILKDYLASQDGKGKLMLENGLSEDAYVKVLRSDKLVVSFYVRAGEKFTFDRIPDGTYQVLYCIGYGWDLARLDFERGRHARSYDSPLTFATRRQTEGDQIVVTTDVLTLTLHQVIGGNAKTSDISLDEFKTY